MDQRWLALKPLRCRNILDPVPLPQSVGTAECGKPAFDRNAGASQNHDVANIHRPSIKRRHDERSTNPRRNRRLDLPTVALGVLSPQAPAIERTRIRLAPSRRDRDQRDLLWTTEAEKLGNLGKHRP